MRPIFSGLCLFIVLGLLTQACGEGRKNVSVPEQSFQFPTGLDVYQQGYATVLSSNYDLSYKSGAFQLIDLLALADRIDEGSGLSSTHQDLISQTARAGLPSFGSALKVVGTGENGLAIALIRETNQLVLVDLQVAEAGGSATISCWAGGIAGSREAFPLCEGARFVLDLEEDDPYDLLVSEIDAYQDKPWIEREWMVYIAYLRSNMISAIHIPPGRSEQADVPRQSHVIETALNGVSELAWSSATGLIYATSRLNPSDANMLNFFDPTQGADANIDQINLYPDLLGSEVRSLDFSEDGSTALALMRNPDLVVFLDVTPDASGIPAHTFLGEVVVCDNPSRLRVHGDYAYVTCAKDDTVYVVDTKTRRMIDLSESVCQGPFDMGFFEHNNLSWALISCFESDVVAVMDIDPESPEFLKVLARVGVLRIED